MIRVRAPWVKNYMNNNGQFYIIPNFETVVLGGTTQKGNYDTSISPQVISVFLLSGQETAGESLFLRNASPADIAISVAG